MVERLPEYLMVTINRFEFDRVTMGRKKLLNNVKIDPVLKFP
jgi:ubiquitin C-terminal hydrolase